MKKRLSRILAIASILSILGIGMSAPAMLGAATSQDVTVTATPQYIAISNDVATWTINNLGTGTENGKGTIAPATTYYTKAVNAANDTTAPSATVLDAECLFSITNISTVNITLTVNWGDFSGGSANMTNSNAGTNGATTYGAYSWYSGQTYTGKVIAKATASSVLWTSSTAGDDTKIGVEILTQTNVWTGSTNSTSTISIIAAISQVK